MMKFKFPDVDSASAFDFALSEPDGLDVYADIDGEIVEILGLDDHEFMVEQITELAEGLRGSRIE